MSDVLQVGERTTHAETKTARATSRGTMVKGLAIVGMGGTAALLLYLTTPKPKAKIEPSPARVGMTVPFERAHEPLVVQAAIKPAAPADLGTTAVVVDGPRSAVQPPGATRDQLMMDSARSAPVTAFSKAVGTIGEQATRLGSVDGESDDKGAFERRLQSPKLVGARAGLIGNRNYVVPMGTSIPCVLETALQSDQPGFTSCVIDRDVLSDNAQVVLMEKGTQVVGEYRGGLKVGQARLHVLWSRAKTPTGVVIELASAATDALGRSGFGGTVDDHFMERFGSAILLSVVSDLTKIGGQIVQDKSGFSANGTTGSGKDAAAIAVEQTAAIAPTLHKYQGELVSIFVSRDLDFSSVYDLQRVGHTRPAQSRTRASVKD
jgi:type IV secretory pathway VirB10-like protein